MEVFPNNERMLGNVPRWVEIFSYENHNFWFDRLRYVIRYWQDQSKEFMEISANIFFEIEPEVFLQHCGLGENEELRKCLILQLWYWQQGTLTHRRSGTIVNRPSLENQTPEQREKRDQTLRDLGLI